MFVLTIDQKDSRNSSDRVPGLLELLSSQELELPFERTVGDEVQAVASSPDAVVNAALLALRQGGWSVGIGVGSVGLPLPASSREAGGEAFIAARAAVERAKKTGDRPPIAVAADPGMRDRRRRKPPPMPKPCWCSLPPWSAAGARPSGGSWNTSTRTNGEPKALQPVCSGSVPRQ